MLKKTGHEYRALEERRKERTRVPSENIPFSALSVVGKDFVATSLTGILILEVHRRALTDRRERSEAIHLICYASPFPICKKEITHLSSNPFVFFCLDGQFFRAGAVSLCL